MEPAPLDLVSQAILVDRIEGFRRIAFLCPAECLAKEVLCKIASRVVRGPQDLSAA
jgi:hypothetical protein